MVNDHLYLTFGAQPWAFLQSLASFVFLTPVSSTQLSEWIWNNFSPSSWLSSCHNNRTWTKRVSRVWTRIGLLFMSYKDWLSWVVGSINFLRINIPRTCVCAHIHLQRSDWDRFKQCWSSVIPFSEHMHGTAHEINVDPLVPQSLLSFLPPIMRAFSSLSMRYECSLCFIRDSQRKCSCVQVVPCLEHQPTPLYNCTGGCDCGVKGIGILLEFFWVFTVQV